MPIPPQPYVDITTGNVFGTLVHGQPFYWYNPTISNAIVSNVGGWMYSAACGWLMTELNPAPLAVSLSGSIGQSFGVWNAGGLHMYLEGDANDYVGKGMAGGRLVLKPPTNASYEARDTIIMGNTCLYGATGGQLFAAGQAGERQ